MARKLRIGYPRDFRLWGEPGSYAVTGNDAGLARQIPMAAGQGSYALTGQAAGFSTTSGGSVGALNTTFTVTSATTGTLPFAFGHPFKDGDVPAGKVAVAAGATDWQCIPVTYWPSGCVKFAFIAGRATWAATGDKVLTLTPGTDARSAITEASLIAASPNVQVDVGGNVVTLASLLGSPLRTVCAGPVMSNWIYRANVSAITTTQISVWFDVRYYAGGRIEVFPWVENGTLLDAATNWTGTINVSVGGTGVYSQAVDIKHHQRLPLVLGSTFSYWIGGDPQITPKHNTAYLQSTRMVPTYGFASPSNTKLNAIQQTYTPGTLAGISTSMGAAGSSAALIPTAQALYITSGADVRAYCSAMVFGLSGGSWSTHYRDTTNDPIAFASRPNITLDVGGTPIIPSSTGGTNGTPVTTHQPSYGYMPFLITGRWWFFEEHLFWATWNYMRSGYDRRRGETAFATAPYYAASGSAGIADTRNGAYANRGAHWSIRTLTQTLALCPSSHACYDSLKTSVEANAGFYEAIYVNGTFASGAWVSPQGILGDYSSTNNSAYSNTVGAWFGAAGWMGLFGIQSWGFATNLGLPISTSAAASMQAVRNHAYSHIVARAGDGTSYNWRRFAVFSYPIGADGTGVPPETWYTTAQSYSQLVANFSLDATLPATLGTSLKQHSSDSDIVSGSSTQQDYAPMAISALAFAVEHNAPGASAGWQRIRSASNWSTLSPINDDPEHGIFPPVEPALPTWFLSATTNQWVALTAPSAASGLVPAVSGSMGSQAGMVNAWGGAFTYGTKFYIHGGGHADYGGNEIGVIDLLQGTPAWSLAIQRTPVGSLLGGTNYYADGRPTSRHTYYGMWVASIGGVPKMLRLNSDMGFAYNGTPVGGAADIRTNAIDAFNLNTNTWEPGAYGPTVITNGSETSMCQDPTTGDIYSENGNNDIYRYRPSDNTSTLVANLSGTEGQGGALVYDATNQRLVRFAGRGTTTANACVYWNIATGTKVSAALTGPGAAAFVTATAAAWGLGVAHDTTRNVAYVMDLTATLWRIRLSDFYVEQVATTGAVPAAGTNQVWGRLKYIAALDAIVYLANWTSPLLVMRCA